MIQHDGIELTLPQIACLLDKVGILALNTSAFHESLIAT